MRCNMISFFEKYSSGPRPQCDICGTPGQGTGVSPGDMQFAVLVNNFDPFTLGLLPCESLMFHAEILAEWHLFVRLSIMDWNLCPRCFRTVQPYFKKIQRI